MLVGRDLELHTIGSLLDGLSAQSPFVLSVTGAPGSGRTAVLEHARRLASEAGATVLVARGALDSGDLAYAGLLTLLRPLERRLDDLAGDRSDALRAALAMRRDRVDAMDVRLALLRVLTAAAEAAPLTVVLDDSDDLDAATIDALRFTFGRLGVDRVGAVVSSRDGHGPLADVATHRLVLGPLSRDALAAVVEAQVGCTAHVAAACAEWADGSPLVALELARSLSADERAGRVALPAVPRASARIVEQLQAELDALPERARRALVVVAADRSGSVSTVNAALDALGEPSIGLDEAEAAGVISIERDRVDFRHPLLRPLAYHLVAARSRRAAHRALASSLVEPHEAAERAWQLVESCDGPDDDVASLLELVAADAVHRGALADAATTFERAARLSVDTGARRARLRAAAVAHLDALACDEGRRVAEAAIAAGDVTAAPLVAEAVERIAGETAALASLEAAGVEPDERWHRRRQLERDAARGDAPDAPSTVDEVLAAALAAKVNGRLDQARAWCAQALVLVPAGCVALRARTEQLAAECERAAPDPALGSLTKAERRVAEAVADGRTNREVADHLFLSVKTVDFHLQGIYRKLGVRSRTELALLLASKGSHA